MSGRYAIFTDGERVFKRGNIGFDGIVLTTFRRLDGTLWCMVERPDRMMWMSPQVDIASYGEAYAPIHGNTTLRANGKPNVAR